jgi:hypothetical protein
VRFAARVPNPTAPDPNTGTRPRSLSPSPDPARLIAERKVRQRQLTDDGKIEITGRDLREREVRARRLSPGGFNESGGQPARDAERRFPIRVKIAVPPQVSAVDSIRSSHGSKRIAVSIGRSHGDRASSSARWRIAQARNAASPSARLLHAAIDS